MNEACQKQVLNEHETEVSNRPFAKVFIEKLTQKLSAQFKKIEETNNSRIEAHKKVNPL